MIRLYINGTEADLGAGGGDALLLFTYAAGDLDAPAVVQNAYSKEVVLPPTQRNAQLFGSASRPDKIRSSADTFDTLARTPFEIRSEAGEVLESGYCKLERASAADGYTLHLFGGLGDFLYGLMYGTDGNKKTLASLAYGSAIDAGLSFTINATAVAAAWARIATYPASIGSAWDVVNFAPMNNGRPADFDCGKALIPVGAGGIRAISGEQGVTEGGVQYALVDLGSEQGEWEVRDLRSYLQRPVFNLRALLHALETRENNGGYTFDWSAIADKWYAGAWMTLPMLDVNNITQGSKTLTLSWYDTEVGNLGTGEVLEPVNFSQSIPSTSKVTINLLFYAALWLDDMDNLYAWLHEDAFIYFRLLAYNSSNEVVASSPVRCLCSELRTNNPGIMAQLLPSNTSVTSKAVNNSILGTFTPDSVEAQEVGVMDIDTGYANTPLVQMTLSGYGIHHLGLAVCGVQGNGGGTLYCRAGVTDEYGEAEDSDQIDGLEVNSTGSNATYDAATRVRSGAYITKDALLGGTASPAELLLSFVKTFGLVLKYDGLAKKVTLCERDAFYAAGTDIDLTARIDRSKAQPLTPNGIEAKWLRFAHGDPGGAFAETYAKKYGAQYGAQRVNTGSPFNADTLEVLDGNAFRAGVTGLAYSRYFLRVTDTNVGTGILPSACLDNKVKYTLWDTENGEAQEHSVRGLTSDVDTDSINAYDEMGAPGYDGFFRLQLAGANGQGGADGSGILIFYEGRAKEYTHLTDDLAAMLNVNDGQPCWLPCLDAVAQTFVPHFTTYRFLRSWGAVIEDSLDMGMPRELDMPDMRYDEGLDIYARRWKAYISDRYNGDAHRVTARVDLRGFQIGQALFANFYYFDGCWWVLEKVSDWCWNNPAPVECTFVRVLDKTAYTNGQN